MRKLEKLLIEFLNALCTVMEITPRRLAEIRKKQSEPQRLEDRPDVLEG